jgi:hypothetical protein
VWWPGSSVSIVPVGTIQCASSPDRPMSTEVAVLLAEPVKLRDGNPGVTTVLFVEMRSTVGPGAVMSIASSPGAYWAPVARMRASYPGSELAPPHAAPTASSAAIVIASGLRIRTPTARGA